MSELRADPEFVGIVARARRRAAELGELRTERPARPFNSPLPPEARAILAEWLSDGGYDAAIAEIGAQDPDLANE